MARVDLPGVLLQRVDDPSFIVQPVGWERTESLSVPGAIEVYASGRRAAYVDSGRTSEYDLQLMHLPKSAYQRLREWMGDTLCFRDRHGRVVFGTFFELEITDFRDEAYDVSLTFSELSYNQEV